MTKPRLAIIGAGISGLTLAEQLQEVAQVQIFEKSRGVGGRMSTRYAENFSFDHGAQCFTARGKPFQKFLRPLLLSNRVAPWLGSVINISNEEGRVSPRFWFETHLVAVPTMNSLCKHLAINLPIKLETEIAPLTIKRSDGWHLQTKSGVDLGVFDLIISTTPPVQTKNLFGNNFAVKEVMMKPCFALMLGFNKKWDRDWIFAKVQNNPIKLISVGSSKPGRNSEVTSLVIHARDNWSEKNLEMDINQVQQILLENFTRVTGINTNDAAYISTHRWRYALVDDSEKTGFFDPVLGLAATSDWACNSRIEDVWIAAMKLAEAIKNIFDNKTSSD